MKRSAIRELAFRLIYSLEIQKPEELEEQVDLYLECNEVEENEAKEYIKDALVRRNVVGILRKYIGEGYREKVLDYFYK